MSSDECPCRPEIREKLDAVHEEIYGNGSSEKALTTRMARLESNVKLLVAVTTSQFFMLAGMAFKLFVSN